MRNRLSAICPYFAMFPDQFANDQVRKYSKVGSLVLDPFCGRGTTILQGLLLNRRVIACDINPVAYCLSGAKAEVPALRTIRRRLETLERTFRQTDLSHIERQRKLLPRFFRRCFYRTTLCELLFLKSKLKWKISYVDRFIAALILGSLHGEMDKSKSYFSNQMPRTISTKPEYSLRYWSKRRLWPLRKPVFSMLKQRAEFRLSTGRPNGQARVLLCDARSLGRRLTGFRGRVTTILTSPPYLDVTNYEEDQWLRLWFLGHAPRPTYGTISKDDRHSKQDKYWDFLRAVWEGIAPLLHKDAKLICRIGARGISPSELKMGLIDSLIQVFPKAKLMKQPQTSVIKNRQTESFRPGSRGCRYEIDFVIKLNPR